MFSDAPNYFDFLIIAGALAVAVAASLFALASTLRRSRSGDDAGGWKEKCADMEQRLGQLDSVFGAYPGLIMIWEESVPDPTSDWGLPKVYGSPAAMASMQRFAEPGKARDMARRILDGLADLDTISDVDLSHTLRAHLSKLRQKGEPFSTSIVLP